MGAIPDANILKGRVLGREGFGTWHQIICDHRTPPPPALPRGRSPVPKTKVSQKKELSTLNSSEPEQRPAMVTFNFHRMRDCCQQSSIRVSWARAKIPSRGRPSLAGISLVVSLVYHAICMGSLEAKGVVLKPWAWPGMSLLAMLLKPYG